MNKQKYPSVIERYYTKYFYKDLPGEDICVLAHSNKVCIVTLAPNHKALAEGPIKSVNFTVNGKDMVAQNKVHGKRKLNAIQTNPQKVICNVISGAGNEYKIRCGINGKLLEVNEHLLTNPSLLSTKFETDGHIAILLHKFSNENKPVCQNLLSEEAYNASLLQENSDGNLQESGDDNLQENSDNLQENSDNLQENSDDNLQESGDNNKV